MRGYPGKVLILGCGTIGQIKAKIWLSLGVDVLLHDINTTQVDKLLLLDQRFTKFSIDDGDEIIVDISTPSDQHAISMQWVFNNIANLQTILIEKPICTNLIDKSLIVSMLNKHNEIPVYVNETYFWSSALEWLLHRLLTKNEKIISVEINLSKNRLSDTRLGRFFDQDLESYGIELPHAFAILQRLGVEMNTLDVVSNTQFLDDTKIFNQGLHLSLSNESIPSIKIDTFLGDTMIKNGVVIKNFLERSLVVKTDQNNIYQLAFDPAPFEERFKSTIVINNIQQIVIDDDHLRKHLEQILHNTMDHTFKQLLSPINSLSIYDFLSSLYVSRKIESMPVADINLIKMEESVRTI